MKRYLLAGLLLAAAVAAALALARALDVDVFGSEP